MERLSRYDRATVALWTRSHAEMARRPADNPLAEAAVHALLARLRQWAERSDLFACYEADAAADFALIGSLLLHGSGSDLAWRVRETAFYLRWLELTDGGR